MLLGSGVRHTAKWKNSMIRNPILVQYLARRYTFDLSLFSWFMYIIMTARLMNNPSPMDNSTPIVAMGVTGESQVAICTCVFHDHPNKGATNAKC
mmetsp:Transcript_13659/g.33035  ORF Transcript_13659/g.33035 Transcript_13659/m.33035 type:complete len:95 (+) Transcript_13659:1246-1530(+)